MVAPRIDAGRMALRPRGHIRICCERLVGRDRHDFGAPTPGARTAVCGYSPSLVESGRVTRRAPPLEIISRHSTIEQSVHRRLRRWTALLVCAAVMTAGCRTVPDVELARSLPLSRSSKPIDMVGP